MDENNEKNYKVEWSFSFEKLGDQIGDFFKSVGSKGDEEIKHGFFSLPMNAATSARTRIDFSVGESTIKALNTSDNLIEADLTYVGEILLEASGDQEKVVQLSQQAAPGDWVRSAIGWIGSGQKLRWDVALTPSIPLNLDLHGGAGRSHFDLSALQLTGLNASTGAGETTLLLAAGQYSARYSGGVGQSNLTVPGGADIDLNVSSGAGEINLDIGSGAAVKARINGGVGQTNINIAADAAVRLEARTGIGSIHTSPRFSRVSGSSGDFWDKGGVWQTANYETAEQKIVIRFDGGVGELNVR